MQTFDETSFRSRVNVALEKVKTILDNSRRPQWPADVHHEYEDKYLLAEFVTTNTISSLVFVLQTLGVNDKHLAQMKDWSKKRSVTLRLSAEETCKFIRKTTREVESDTKSVNKSTLFGKSESYTVTKIHEWFWGFEAKYELIAFMGNEPDKPLVLQGRRGAYEIKTTSETTPKPEKVVRSSVDLNITWLLNHIDESSKPKFHIDRGVKNCHTPRRNPDIDEAFIFLVHAYGWATQVQTYFRRDLFSVQTDHGLDLNNLRDAGVFVPVLPVFEKPTEMTVVKEVKEKKEKKEKKDKKDKKDKKKVSSKNLHLARAVAVPFNMSEPFLSEQARSLGERFTNLATVFPANDKLVTVVEAKLIVLMMHMAAICSSFSDCVDLIEDMLRKQLIAAIGKEVQPTDFTNYLRFHNRKLFRPEYQPRPFCYAIRRPAHVPEGTLSIEAALDDGLLADPIFTSVCYAPAQKPMKFALNAATNVSFGGDRFLHAWVSYQFSGYSGQQLNLVARARQFSSFILLVGSLAGPELFIPKHAIIIKDKDDLKIPLILETIPTPKEFKDAIASLSPEQQRFARGFRSLQLESTLFGVCVIQIKPQLEKLLNLPADALTKEIALSQELLNLFIEYQIPSDLLSYDGPENSAPPVKVQRVQELANNMRQMLKQAQATELAEAKQEQNMRLADIDLEMSDRDEDDCDREFAEEERIVAPKKNVRRKAKPEKLMKSKDKMKEKEGAVEKRKKSSKADIRPSPKSTSSGTTTLTQTTTPTPTPTPTNAATTPTSGATPASPRSAQPSEGEKKEKGEVEKVEETEVSKLPAGQMAADLTKVPQQLERKFEVLDPDSSLRPTIISTGPDWRKTFKRALLSPPETTTVQTEQQGIERNKTFDLLDALTKSGALTIDHAALHVVIAATHCFDKTLMNTVIQDNVNPIEKIERSSLIVASTIQNRAPVDLISAEHIERIKQFSPMLLEDVDVDDDEEVPAPAPQALPVVATKQ